MDGKNCVLVPVRASLPCAVPSVVRRKREFYHAWREEGVKTACLRARHAGAQGSQGEEGKYAKREGGERKESRGAEKAAEPEAARRRGASAREARPSRGESRVTKRISERYYDRSSGCGEKTIHRLMNDTQNPRTGEAHDSHCCSHCCSCYTHQK